MHVSVKDRFKAFNEPLEGVVRYMYLDVKGLITIGVGNLIDPLSTALGLPFRYKYKPGIKNAGQLASKADIEAEWKLIKGKQDLAQRGHRACEPLTKLELDDAAINTLINNRLLQNERFLKGQKVFKNFDQWPADAQLGLLSMAWAMGPGFSATWHRFSVACEKMDFDGAAENCRISEAGNPGVVPRNKANKHLFQNAAAVVAGEADGFYQRQTLYYQQILMKPITIIG
jgi:GH24 family phage-related lysozyme (muramidase)